MSRDISISRLRAALLLNSSVTAQEAAVQGSGQRGPLEVEVKVRVGLRDEGQDQDAARVGGPCGPEIRTYLQAMDKYYVRPDGGSLEGLGSCYTWQSYRRRKVPCPVRTLGTLERNVHYLGRSAAYTMCHDERRRDGRQDLGEAVTCAGDRHALRISPYTVAPVEGVDDTLVPSLPQDSNERRPQARITRSLDRRPTLSRCKVGGAAGRRGTPHTHTYTETHRHTLPCTVLTAQDSGSWVVGLVPCYKEYLAWRPC